MHFHARVSWRSWASPVHRRRGGNAALPKDQHGLSSFAATPTRDSERGTALASVAPQRSGRNFLDVDHFWRLLTRLAVIGRFLDRLRFQLRGRVTFALHDLRVKHGMAPLPRSCTVFIVRCCGVLRRRRCRNNRNHHLVQRQVMDHVTHSR